MEHSMNEYLDLDKAMDSFRDYSIHELEQTLSIIQSYREGSAEPSLIDEICRRLQETIIQNRNQNIDDVLD